jgi:hypothetical protein
VIYVVVLVSFTRRSRVIFKSKDNTVSCLDLDFNEDAVSMVCHLSDITHHIKGYSIFIYLVCAPDPHAIKSVLV